MWGTSSSVLSNKFQAVAFGKYFEANLTNIIYYLLSELQSILIRYFVQKWSYNDLFLLRLLGMWLENKENHLEVHLEQKKYLFIPIFPEQITRKIPSSEPKKQFVQ